MKWEKPVCETGLVALAEKKLLLVYIGDALNFKNHLYLMDI